MIRKALPGGLACVILAALQGQGFAQPLQSGETMWNAAYAKEVQAKHDEAIQGYRAMLNRFPSGEYAASALYRLASVQYNGLKDVDAAVKTYQELISRCPNANPSLAYHAASGLITIADQFHRPQLKAKAYRVMLDVCKGSWNRSGMHASLISWYGSQKNEALAREQIEEMFRECAAEPNFRANVESLIGQLVGTPEMKPLADFVRKRLDGLPPYSDPDVAIYKEYQDLLAAKDYAGAVAKAEALAKNSPQGYHTPSVLQNAQSLAENQLKDMEKARDLCRLWAMSMRGEDEGDNLRQALYAWVRACTMLKDAAGAREAADYARSKFPYCSATDDVLLMAAKARCQDGKFWTDNAAMADALALFRAIPREYPYGSALLEAKWFEERLAKIIRLNKEVSD